jgi:hypothetical protein
MGRLGHKRSKMGRLGHKRSRKIIWKWTADGQYFVALAYEC